MLSDAYSAPQDSEVIERLTLDDLNQASIESYRNIMRATRMSSTWPSEPRDRFLMLLGAADRGEDGEMHPTLAGLLMFGMDYLITKHLGGYKVEYRECSSNTGGWSYRLISDSSEWSGNLFDFFSKVNERLFINTSVPFELDGVKRTDESDYLKAKRELVVNGIVHADYRMPGGVRTISSPEKLVVINPGFFRVPIARAEEGGISDPRNPSIMKMFMLIGYVESSGEGMRRILEVCSKLNVGMPSFKEEMEPSRVIAEIPTFEMNAGSALSEQESAVLNMLRKDGTMTVKRLATELGMSISTVSRALSALKSNGIIRCEGNNRTGKWVIIDRRT